MGIILISLYATSVQAENRVALVIGNSDYDHSPLANPKNDAALMADTLRQVGFSVTLLIDADQRSMKRAMIEFGRKLRGSDSVGLFYYAGHGVQVEGENFLIPIGAIIDDELEVSIEAVSVNEFLRTMKRASSRINIVVLDACRNNPYARSFRSNVRGLARVDAPKGTYVAYATSPGAIALDGKSGHSPYTSALTKAMLSPGLLIEQVFKQARREVLETTNEKQTPWETSSITGRFYFSPAPTEPKQVSTQPSNDGSAMELAYWNTIKNTKNPAFLRSYLRQYPTGVFADLAQTMLEQMEADDTSQLNAKPQIVLEPAQDASRQELAYWNSVKDRNDESLLRSYLRRYPDGLFAELAAIKIEKLQAAGNTDKNEPQLAAIEPDAVQAAQPDNPGADDPDLARKIQTALSTVGCDPGTPDGVWGKKSSAALTRYAKHAGITVPEREVSTETLSLLSGRTDRVCPLVCTRGQTLIDGRCVATAPKAYRPSRKSRLNSKQFRQLQRFLNSRRTNPSGTERANGGKCALATQCGREN